MLEKLARLDAARPRRPLQRTTSRATHVIVASRLSADFDKARASSIRDVNRESPGEVARDPILQREQIGGGLVEAARPVHAALVVDEPH